MTFVSTAVIYSKHGQFVLSGNGCHPTFYCCHKSFHALTIDNYTLQVHVLDLGVCTIQHLATEKWLYWYHLFIVCNSVKINNTFPPWRLQGHYTPICLQLPKWQNVPFPMLVIWSLLKRFTKQLRLYEGGDFFTETWSVYDLDGTFCINQLKLIEQGLVSSTKNFCCTKFYKVCLMLRIMSG